MILLRSKYRSIVQAGLLFSTANNSLKERFLKKYSFKEVLRFFSDLKKCLTDHVFGYGTLRYRLRTNWCTLFYDTGGHLSVDIFSLGRTLRWIDLFSFKEVFFFFYYDLKHY